MSLRHVLYSILTTTPGITAVYGDRIIDASNLGEDAGSIPARPFLVTKFGARTPGPSRTSYSREVDLWSYGELGDFTVVEQGLDAVYAALHDRVGDKATTEGVTTHLMGAALLSVSRDLVDDVYRATAQYATYRLVGNTQ